MPLELDVMTYRSMYEARYSKIATGIMCQSTFLHILSISCGSYCERTLLVATPCPSVLLSLSEPVDDSEVEARFKSDILTTVGLQAGGWYKHKRRGDRVAPSYISPDSRKKPWDQMPLSGSRKLLRASLRLAQCVKRILRNVVILVHAIVIERFPFG